ncbi:MAG: LicD family protein [Clostridiaceae bacterium]|nr:LicD family protein [Clostridiaceae bacterium]
MNSTVLRRHQLECVQILLVFRRICNQLGLQYYLISGTLLGAVRHRGFIPWDDDIDIGMPRKDYEIFARRCPELLGENYFFQDFRSEPNFPYYFAKIRRKGTAADEPLLREIDMEQGIYIDIFPLDSCPDCDILAKLFFKQIELLDCAVLSQVCCSFVCGYQKPYMQALFSFFRRLPRKQIFALREVCRRTAGCLSSGKRLCTVGGRHGFPRETYLASWFSRTEEAEFEGVRFPIPVGWSDMLQNMYGNYMEYPPVSERGGHLGKR